MDHEQLRELAEPYALGILSADDRQAFERHLPLCETCQQAVLDAQIVGLALGQSVEMVDPPSQLRSQRHDRGLVRPYRQRPRRVEGAGRH